MKNRIITLSLREIKSSYKRFLSLMLMSFLGVAVFIGLRSANNVLISSLDKYYDVHDLYDIKIVSTLGLTDDDIEAIRKLDSTLKVIGIHSKDVYFHNGDNTLVIRIFEDRDDINSAALEEGRMPITKDEIAVEYTFLDRCNLKIGDVITIKDEDDTLRESKLKIVGTVTSPLYILNSSPSTDRGSTTLGSGQVTFYTYGSKYLFKADYYSEVYVTVKDAKEKITNSKEYNELIDKTVEDINSIKEVREKARYDSLYNELVKEVDKNEKKGRNELNKAKSELDRFKSELDKGSSRLTQAKRDIENGKKDLEKASSLIKKGKEDIKNGEAALNKAKKELASAESEINAKLKKYHLTLDDVVVLKDILYGNEVSRDKIKKIVRQQNLFHHRDIEKFIDYVYDNNYYSRLKELINTGTEYAKERVIEIIPKDYEDYDEVVNYIRNLKCSEIRDKVIERLIDTNSIRTIRNRIPKNTKNYDRIITFLDKYIDTVDNIKLLFNSASKFDEAKKELANKEMQLNNAKNELIQGEKSYEYNKKKIADAEVALKDGQIEYNKNLKLYNSYYNTYFRNKTSFEKQIANARRDINSLQIATWYVDSRLNNSDYSGFINIGDSVDNLAKAFPTVFFVVAIFMSIMSMSRMALEDREEIGSLKAMGFSSTHIIVKYIVYSVVATLIGGILGSIFGFYFLTWFVWRIYGILYRILEFEYYYDFSHVIIGILIAILCIGGTSSLTVIGILREKPSELLRPKAPTIGKKIIFEYLPFWNKISFSNKVTIRNICRYKKRVIMTIVGIVGCTILMITGYGIKDSITGIASKQFNEVINYDDLVFVKENSKELDSILNDSHIKYKAKYRLSQVTVGTTNVNLQAVENVKDYMNIFKGKSTVTGKDVTITKGKVIVSDKLARIHKLKVGSKIKFSDVKNKTYEVEISDIFENYVASYIIMDYETYEDVINGYMTNSVYIKLDDLKNEEAFLKNILKSEDVLTVQSLSSITTMVNNMLVSLDKVVVILIVLSGALSFVVLYNLSYINISERRREIATLKVLGFYNTEVDNYIIKENFIITVIGILIGLLICKPFVNFIVDSIEIDLVKFIHHINIESYLLSFMFLTIFTLIVSFIIHFALKKIDMIESLKSVE